LHFSQNDARELAEVLEDPETCGFETRLYLNRRSRSQPLTKWSIFASPRSCRTPFRHQTAAKGIDNITRVDQRMKVGECNSAFWQA
jgi:hypothetical protein